MKFRPSAEADQNRGTALYAVVCLCFCALISGCQVYPEVPRKSLAQLYYEAVASTQNTPDRSGEVATTSNTLFLPPAQSAPQEVPLTPVPQNSLVPSPEPQPEKIAVPLLHSAAEELPAEAETTDGWRPAGGRRTPRRGVRQVAHTVVEPGPLVTEFFEDTDVRQALQSLAQQAEVAMIIDEQIGGVVSAVIEDEPFEVALKKVLLPLGLVFSRTKEGEYIVGVPDPSSPLFSKLSVRAEYRPMHLSPLELAGLIPERDNKFIQVVDQRNKILIEAPAEIAEGLLERLKQFDTPIPQVELEAIVCVVSPDHGFKSGLDWGHALTLNGSDVFNFGLAGLAFTGQGSGAGFSNAFSDFAVTSAFVKLLAQEGYLAIRAAPRVTARDGDQARISITRQSFFSTQPQSDTAFFRQEIEQVEAGIELDITPVIRGDNITVKIEKAEVSEDIRTSQINSGITENPFPQINRRSVSTTVHVKDGETVVIGGLVQRQTVDRIAKIPVLGEIPGIGRVFQTVEQKEQDAEVVIFISPRLVQPQSSASKPSTAGRP